MVRLKALSANPPVEAKLFQFLMVRLKDCQHLEWLKKNHVSIPYGTIKSSELDEYYQGVMLFQFLMVRLKA